MPYSDCTCTFHGQGLSNTSCTYITHNFFLDTKRRSDTAKSKTAAHNVMKEISKHPIINAFMEAGVPLSDWIHGIYHMLPPEKLHTTDEGITEHMISTLAKMIGEDAEGTYIW